MARTTSCVGVLLGALAISACGEGGATGVERHAAAGGSAGDAGGSAAIGGSAGDAGGSAAIGGGNASGGAGGGVLGSAGAAPGFGGELGATAPLPEGNTGIAARYPGDRGIEADPAVVFADDFESYATGGDLDARWTYAYQSQYIGIATAATNVYSGTRALELSLPQQEAELSDGVDRDLSPELEVLFLRYYAKIAAPFDVVGSSHNGAGISAHYFGPNNAATPGVPADGTNKFLVNLENWRGEASTASPGLLNTYVYHPEQRSQWGDHFFPTGLVSPNTSEPFDFGDRFVPREDRIPDLDRWYCYELMVRANTPGERDGRIAAWLDGVLVMDFMNLRLRDVAELTINRFGLSFHIGSNPNGEATKWYDNVVAATAYIGPLAE